MISKSIFRAVNKHFDSFKGDLPIFFRADDQQNIETRVNRAELRIDGPYTRVLAGVVRYDVEVNLLFSVHMTDKSLYTINELLDRFRLAMIGANGKRVPILVYDDNNVFLGCLRLTPIVSGDREVREYHFGEIDNKTRLQQASLEGHYRMET